MGARGHRALLEHGPGNRETLNLRIVTGTGGFIDIVDWLFIAMIENLTKSMSHMACFLFGSSQLKDSIFTRQHKMAHELQLPLLNQKCTF